MMKMFKMLLNMLKMTVYQVETTISAINRGGNPMPTVTGYLDDVEQLDVDTVQVEMIFPCISGNIYFCTIQNEEDGGWEVEKEYTFIPSRSLLSLLSDVFFIKVVLSHPIQSKSTYSNTVLHPNGLVLLSSSSMDVVTNGVDWQTPGRIAGRR